MCSESNRQLPLHLTVQSICGHSILPQIFRPPFPAQYCEGRGSPYCILNSFNYKGLIFFVKNFFHITKTCLKGSKTQRKNYSLFLCALVSWWPYNFPV